jgi:uncharacterized protein (TIGR03435 family)
MHDLMSLARAAGTVAPSPNGANGSPSDAASDPAGGSLFAAMQGLGLKLDARKAPVDMIVVDQAEKMPTAN